MFFRLKISTIMFLAGLLAVPPNGAVASDLNISQSPLFQATTVDPNIMFTLDDSGSMQWEMMPDSMLGGLYYLFPRPVGLYGAADYDARIPWFDDALPRNLRTRSATAGGGGGENAVFYNPQTTYRPWVRADGSEFPPAVPTAAYHNPTSTGLGSINLTARQTHNRWFDTTNSSSAREFWPITFYMYDGVGDRHVPASYTKFQIRGNQAFTATPADGPALEITEFVWADGLTRSIAEETQNFANWYTYHRSRILAARAGIGRAFQELPDSVRLGFGTINAPARTVDGVSTNTIVDPVRPLTPAQRQAFYDRLYTWPIGTAGTPLRRSAFSVGRYFERTDNRGPWSSTPGVDAGVESHLACRQSFHVLMTDGFWNGPSQGVGNVDNSSGPTITDPDGQSYQYVAVGPFRDGHSDTLADVAMHFWKRDLRPDLANRVPTNSLNPAFWQHVSSFGVGLGVQGTLDPAMVFDAIQTETDISWPNPALSDPAKIDDLLHFGLNGRGGFFTADDPDSFAEGLGRVLRDIVGRTAANIGAAVSASRLIEGSFVYIASLERDNSGELIAVNAANGNVEWEASAELESLGHDQRNIWTLGPDGPVRFTAAANEIEGRLMANSPAGGDWTFANLVNYIRGSSALEQRNGGSFRDRNSILGTLVNSRPEFSGQRNEGWRGLNYENYLLGAKRDPRDCTGDEANSCRKKDAVYVGGNGGMLHAFDARTGRELFAYMPSSVHRNLHELADPDFAHRFFVDGQITIADARIGTGIASAWRTVLVGGLGAGGRGIYALDVSEPQNFDDSRVLWEFTHEDDPDLGYTFGRVEIGLLGNRWVAIFGNGYNSANGQAFLFVLDLKSGEVLHKIALGSPGGNGLSGVIGWRSLAPNNNRTERIYAGDLKGTIWRVDHSGNAITRPTVRYPNGLFTDPNGRSITAAPSLTAHPEGGLVVYFGTGRLIENNDRFNVAMDRFYALRDRDQAVGNTVGAMNDFGQAAINTAPASGGKPPLREVSNPGGIRPNGWFVDLAVGPPSGERVLAPPRILFGRVMLPTYEPTSDPCLPGGIQRIYVLDALTGDGALPFCPGCGGMEVGAGAPFSSTVSIRPPQGRSGATVLFPGLIDPADPGQMPTLPEAPDGPAIDREWCSQFGIPPMFVGGPFISLGSVCEGRQVWRQIR